ncbi:MAG TPA: TetR/AcrR family transcriptional regulator [Hellea balneolensis]|uniref:TetR/AcrR family transcriptional regulator n=1 Tax=Hellea balneolensis TaxID=287478 RepID=A0A7C5QWB5_9PROT|nr:TetR/AcrR family transcriptional regulator [Hellea balneolensis]
MKENKTYQKIVQAADDLFYRHGFEHTSFADIAQAVQISRGNFYYHFKTKDEILEAVIAKRLSDREDMLNVWAQQGETPQERINSFISILLVNSEKIKKYGCPIGTLTSELAKMNHKAIENANGLFTLFRVWLKQQFMLMGHDRNADIYALHILARSQGVATLANAFCDDEFINREVALLQEWVAALPKVKS